MRRITLDRRALLRRQSSVDVLGHTIAVKVVTLPDGSVRGKPEFEDAQRVARATGRPLREVQRLAGEAAGKA